MGIIDFSHNLSLINNLTELYFNRIFLLIIENNIQEEGIIEFSKNLKFIPNLSKLSVGSIVINLNIK